MICNHAKECNSVECGHKRSHLTNRFCAEGTCHWAGDTACIAESKRELVENLLDSDALTTMKDCDLVDAIMAIFEEVAA